MIEANGGKLAKSQNQSISDSQVDELLKLFDATIRGVSGTRYRYVSNNRQRFFNFLYGKLAFENSSAGPCRHETLNLENSEDALGPFLADPIRVGHYQKGLLKMFLHGYCSLIHLKENLVGWKIISCVAYGSCSLLFTPSTTSALLLFFFYFFQTLSFYNV